ncbi:MAG: V-type ATPase 116kDa subunit family protein [Vicinamibacterales bacterium]|nr:V-type ATPase 116kDa subunit family protein [Vicinamibacterales bacterium]MDP7480655.1 V-type ATPase 116kDa subunit family protein [Vicinamibacterales bacterium]HJN46826.1 V-type ATPase 116kDa subunit family protein [Vicinamibacterales bacterium]
MPAIFQPAASLVALYGTPGHDEINPALVLALTTPLFFGMMFGDVGYGLVLLAATVAARRQLGQWTPVAVTCSLASAGFGLLCGSVFGVEHWLPAVWLRPVEEPFRLLAAALWAGVAFIFTTFVLKASTLFRQGRRLEACIGLPGGAGALAYAGAVLGVRALYAQQGVPLIAWGAVLAGTTTAALYAVLEIRAHGRSKMADLASDYFHLLLTLLTNTLSFLRLAAFAMSHAALSTALFLVLETIPQTPAWWAVRIPVLLLGATLILVLHTLVVAIQTIRLEFYEGLTRYYRGDGRPYRPLSFPARTPT